MSNGTRTLRDGTPLLDGSTELGGTVKRASGSHPLCGPCELRLAADHKPVWSVVLHYTNPKGQRESRVAGRGDRVEAEAAFSKLVGQMAAVTMEG